MNWPNIVYGIERPERPVETVAEKRAAIYRAQHDCSLVRNCMILQQRDGLSGEELMVLIAYHALRQVQDGHEAMSELLNKLPPPPMLKPGG